LTIFSVLTLNYQTGLEIEARDTARSMLSKVDRFEQSQKSKKYKYIDSLTSFNSILQYGDAIAAWIRTRSVWNAVNKANRANHG
jgi:hypothetical protein